MFRDGTLKAIEGAQLDYARALREIEIADRDAYAEAQRAFEETARAAQGGYEERITEASRSARDRDAGSGADATAQSDYTGELQRAWVDAQDRLADAQRAYNDAAGDLVERSADAHRRAFAAYVREVQGAVASIDPDTALPQALANTAIAIHATAMHAAATPAGLMPAAGPPTGNAGGTKTASKK